ncbi:MAG: Dabb family protein [Deltaproteobacteria bacterium]
MIRHIVAVRFRAELTLNDRNLIWDALAALQDVVPGAMDFRVFDNISPEDNVIHGFRHLFWFDFRNTESRDAYLVHPDHQSAGSRLVAACEGGVQGIQVMDVEL